MRVLNCLYMEDIEGDYKEVSERLTAALRFPDVKLHVAPMITSDFDVTRELERNAHQYEILLVDIFQEISGKEYDVGLNVLEEASKHPHLVIIGISQKDDTHLLYRFQAKGGHGLIGKSWVKTATASEIREKLRPLIEAGGYLLSPPKLSHAQEALGGEVEYVPLAEAKNVDRRLMAEIHELGANTIEVLLRELVPNWDSVNYFVPYYLKQGLSGAHVLRIDMMGKTKSLMGSILVKFSKDKKKLGRELNSAPEEWMLVSHAYVQYAVRRGVKSFGEWHAIYATFLDNTMTLEEWLLNTELVEPAVPTLMDVIFGKNLRAAYEQVIHVPEKSAFEVLKQSSRTAAHVLAGFNLLGELLERRRVPFAEPRHFLETFILDGRIGSRPEGSLPKGTHLLESHGDLHARNILVRRDTAEAKLIDAGNRGEYHWAKDPARFCATLWLNAWDKENHHFWDNLGTWRKHVRSWHAGKELKVSNPADHRIMEALLYARAMVKDVFKKAYAEWEFDLALALEFLTFSRYSDIPMPKRCLALLAAYDILSTTRIPC